MPPVKVKLFAPSQDKEMTFRLELTLAELKRRSIEPELIDTDSSAGAALQELYGVMRYPSLVVTMDDGREVRSWHGQIPPAEEIQGAMGSL